MKGSAQPGDPRADNYHREVLFFQRSHFRCGMLFLVSRVKMNLPGDRNAKTLLCRPASSSRGNGKLPCQRCPVGSRSTVIVPGIQLPLYLWQGESGVLERKFRHNFQTSTSGCGAC
jgi:hypothetical protein